MEEFWTGATAAPLGAIATGLIVAVIVGVSGRLWRGRASPAPATAPMLNDAAVASGGSIAIKDVSDRARVTAEVKSVKKSKHVHNHRGYPAAKAAPDGQQGASGDEWLPVVIVMAGLLAATFVFVKWNEYVLLGTGIVLGAALGAFGGTVSLPIARRSWNRGATAVSVQAGLTSIAAVVSWIGILNVDKGGWNLHRLQMLVDLQERGELRQQGGFFGAILRDGGMPVAGGLVVAVFAVLGSIFVFWVSLLRWWQYLAAVAGRVKRRKRAKQYLKFGRWRHVVAFITIPLILGAFGGTFAFALLPPT